MLWWKNDKMVISEDASCGCVYATIAVPRTEPQPEFVPELSTLDKGYFAVVYSSPY